MYSMISCSILKKYENRISQMALSAVEASTALAHVLSELHRVPTSPAARPDDDESIADNDSDCQDMDTESNDDLDLSLSEDCLSVHS